MKKKIENQYIVKDILFEDQGKEYHFFEKVKLHTLAEIENYALKYGFESVKTFGDYSLGEFDLENSPRCINLFQKKK